MSKHTPGPWIIDTATRGYEVCTIHHLPPTETGQTWAYVYPCSDGWSEADEQAANARLIAAAPELLSSLKDCRALAMLSDRQKDDREVVSKILEAAFDAIAKAEGRT